ncbi:MAG: cyanase [Gammaproteobacteria bacterium]|nr:cyanase [Gammaproteobacteria bacterium]
MKREELTEAIQDARRERGLTWKQLAEKVGRSPVWTTAALLGQMKMAREEAERAGKALGLDEQAIALLQTVPTRGESMDTVPVDPTIYRFYELLQVYGPTWKELIHEEFGDGIMSAIDFEMSLERQPDPKGDRVKIVMSGKFLPYKTY